MKIERDELGVLEARIDDPAALAELTSNLMNGLREIPKSPAVNAANAAGLKCTLQFTVAMVWETPE